jgi:NCAIR mutase (PurE)-related protein
MKIKDFCNFDLDREQRRGVPEIVLAEGKSEGQLVEIVKRVYGGGKKLIITRLDEKAAKSIQKIAPTDYNHTARVAVVGEREKRRDRKIAILTAGTADVAVAEEACIVAEEMGCSVTRGYDVGVAGIHRLVPCLEEIRKEGIRVVIVVAGMEGALPSVVSGLTDALVIGVPTSTGYGYGGKGEAALMAMLQSCSPGVVVVNIDNGVGAGIAAALAAVGR